METSEYFFVNVFVVNVRHLQDTFLETTPILPMFRPESPERQTLREDRHTSFSHVEKICKKGL